MSRIEQALQKAKQKRLSDNKQQIDTANLANDSADTSSANGIQSTAIRNPDQLLTVKPLVVENKMLITALEERTGAVEEYNKLRSTIISLTRGETFLNSLIITSCAPSEGKSITALNLAISLAKEQDHTVLLVDADLRRPSLHRYLGISPEYGLAHCLRDGLPIEKALVKTGLGKLVLLPAGDVIKDPLDMLSSKRMKDIIVELKERYSERYVIIDTPPAVPFADAGVLSKMVDSTLFVVREGVATKGVVAKTLSEFKRKGLLGVVYNDSSAASKKNGYYYYY